MPINIKLFAACIVIALLLCASQILGSTMLILICLVAFLALLGWSCIQNFTLPILLFFLPWSSLLRTSPSSFSFFTFGLVMVCAIGVVKTRLWVKRNHIVIGILLVVMSLFSKFMDGYDLSFDYIAFMMMILLFPTVKEEWVAKKYDFYQTVVFFSMGVIIAALCAQRFASYPNIAKYIRVDSYSTITRLCGFYGDPNFYTAQITAALGGGLVEILNVKYKKQTVFLGVLLFMLLYCGFLSGSKSFVLITASILILWIIEVMRMRGNGGRKAVLIVGVILIGIIIASSSIFSGLIDVLDTRFSNADNMSDFTTGRTDLWKSYIDTLSEDGKLLLLGNGFTNVKINERASHNTIIQAVFQFGLLGVPLLLGWCVSFFQDLPKAAGPRQKHTIRSLILILGSFMPWLAIDALFFDEFFLLQWYVFMGLQELRSPSLHRNKIKEIS